MPRCRYLCCLLACASLFLKSAILLAQGSESGSWIIQLNAGIEVKEFSEGLLQRAADLGTPVNLSTVVLEVNPSRAFLASRTLDRYLVLDCDQSFVRSLHSVPGVMALFPNYTYRIEVDEPNDVLFGEQWALQRIKGVEAWDITTGDTTVLIGVIDTGIEWKHPDLHDAVWVNHLEDRNGNGQFDPWPLDEVREGVAGDLDGIDQDGNGYADDVIGFDMVDQNIPNFGDWSGRDGVPLDEQGHGTNVAGVIGATRNNGIGIAGIAPGCRIVPIRAFDATGDGQDDDIAAAIIYAANIGVDVINMSFGDTYRSPLLQDAVRYAYARGVVLVASSGNDGVPDPHYPSGFEEVISVGATTDQDLLTIFSTFGSQLSLVAPGQDVLTTDLDGKYRTVTGTSFSSSYVAGVAGLLRTLHPGWKPEEVQGALELSASDLGTKGWDENYGAGILDAEAALLWPGPAVLEIISPRIDQGAAADTTIDVVGSVVTPFLESWSLDYGVGEVPSDWITIGSGNEGVLNSSLAEFSTSALNDTIYTIRLQLLLTKGRWYERRIRFYVDRTPPVPLSETIQNLWLYDRRVLGVRLKTDDRTHARLWLRPSGGDAPYLPYELEAERTGLTRTHFWFITHEEIEPGIPYDMYITLSNPAGLVSTIGSPESPRSVTVPAESFPLTSMSKRAWSAPYGYVLPDQPSVIDPETPELLMNRLDDFAFGPLILYQFDGISFVPADSTDSWLPRGVGDTDGNKLYEILGQSSGTGILYEQEAPSGKPFASVKFSETEANSFYFSGLFDFDGDGRDELIGYREDSRTHEQYYVVSRWSGSAYSEIARLENPTSPEDGSAVNILGASDIAICDVNGNGKMEILFSDTDDDFVLYEYRGEDQFALLWFEENDGREGDNRNMFAAGDIDNNGRDELLLAYRAPLFHNEDKEYEPPLWTIRVLRFSEGGDALEMAREGVAWVRGATDFRTGIRTGELDGKPGDEIALSIFPSLYLFRWDSGLGRLKPFWWRGRSIINQPIIRDFDKDGTNELGAGDGTRISFYQIDPTFDGPAPPAGLDGWTLSDSTAFLRWDSVQGAEQYRVYRAFLDVPENQVTFSLIVETDQTQFVDTGLGTSTGRLDAEANYGYIVTAIDTEALDSESNGSEAIRLFTHNPVKPIGAEAINGTQIVIRTSEELREGLYRTGVITLIREEDSEGVRVSTIQYQGGRTLLLTLLEDHSGERLMIRFTSLLRDLYGSPADTSQVLSVKMLDPAPGEIFIAGKAEPMQGKRIVITFNQSVEEKSAGLIDNYHVDPPGTILAIEFDSENSRKVILQMEEDYLLGPFGFDYTITIKGVRSSTGNLLNQGAGSVVGFTISSDNLDNLFVYPHPFSLSKHEFVTFAGLPKIALIKIYTQAGLFLREIEVNRGHGGGARWDGKDSRGKPLPAGIYLYRVALKTTDGSEIDSRLKKIAIVP